MKCNKKIIKWAVIVLGLSVIGIFFGTKLLSGKSDAAALSDSTTTTSSVIRGTIKSTVTGTGSIATAREQELTSPGSATLLEAHAEDGDAVKKGDLLFVLDCPEVESAQQALNQYQYQLDEYNKARDDLIKYAENEYQVLAVNVKDGEKVTKNTVLMTLQDIQAMTLQVPAEDGANWQDGQSLTIEFIEYSDTIKGTLLGSPTKSTSNGKEYLTFELKLESGQRLTGETYAMAVNQSYGNEAAILLKPKTEISIKAPADGYVDKLGVKEGETVAAGSLLYQMSSTTLESQISEASAESAEQQAALKQKSTTITAEFDGIYYAAADSSGPQNTFLQEGDSLDANESLGKVVDSSRMQIVFNVDELDIGKVAVGQKVSVVADALSDVTYEGTVVRIAQEGTSSNNVSYYWVVIEISQWEGLKVGMTASIEIVSEEAENALLVPINAVHTARGVKYVILAEDQSPDTASGSRTGSAGSNRGTAGSSGAGNENSLTSDSSGISKEGGEAGNPAAETAPKIQDTGGNPEKDSTAKEDTASAQSGAGSSEAEESSAAGESSSAAPDVTVMLPERAVIVETGIISDDYVEILSGLSEGQVVEVAATVSSSNTNMMMMGGAMGGGMGGGMSVTVGGPSGGPSGNMR